MDFEEVNNWKKAKEMWTRFNTTEQTVIERVLDELDDDVEVCDDDLLDMINHQYNLIGEANDDCGYVTDLIDEEDILDYIRVRNRCIKGVEQ